MRCPRKLFLPNDSDGIGRECGGEGVDRAGIDGLLTAFTKEGDTLGLGGFGIHFQSSTFG